MPTDQVPAKGRAGALEQSHSQVVISLEVGSRKTDVNTDPIGIVPSSQKSLDDYSRLQTSITDHNP
jgi:hypothetical protein